MKIEIKINADNTCELICEDIRMNQKFETHELDMHFGHDERGLPTGEEVFTIKLINRARK